MTKIVISSTGFDEADKRLSRIPVAVRGKSAKSAVRAAARVVANQYRKELQSRKKKRTQRRNEKGQYLAATQEERKDGKPPLASLVTVRVVQYQSGNTVAVAGAKWDGGRHAHLVEEGHQMWLWGKQTSAKVEGKHDMLTAINKTESKAKAAFEKRITAEIKKHGG